MRTAAALALGLLLGGPLTAVAADAWAEATLSWSRPVIPEIGAAKAAMQAELPANGLLRFDTDGLIDSYAVQGDDRACAVSVPRDTTFKLGLLARDGVSYMLTRASGSPATVKYSGEPSTPAAMSEPDPSTQTIPATPPRPTVQDSATATNQKVYPPRLRGVESLRCSSDKVAAAGVWRTPEGYLERVGEERRSNTTTWRIVVAGDQAVVARVDGTSGAVIDPEVWAVESSPWGGMDDGTGLILTPLKRGPGVSPEAITIDERTSSFVYTTQHVNPFYNRANVFYGTCLSQ